MCITGFSTLMHFHGSSDNIIEFGLQNKCSIKVCSKK